MHQTLPLMEAINRDERQDYEQNVTLGFTVSELLACQAIDAPGARDVKDNNLTNDLCPVFA